MKTPKLLYLFDIAIALPLIITLLFSREISPTYQSTHPQLLPALLLGSLIIAGFGMFIAIIFHAHYQQKEYH